VLGGVQCAEEREPAAKKQTKKEGKINKQLAHHSFPFSFLTGRNPSDEEMVSCFFQKQMGPRPTG